MALKGLAIIMLQIFYFRHAPNFKEVERTYWFGPVRPSAGVSVCPSIYPSICLSVCPSVTLACGEEWLELGS